jgi:MFS transporter, PPP family, 3-phenylpropionic acid transporter
MSPTASARLAYLAMYGAVGASFPYYAVFYESRGLGLATIGLLTSLAAATGLVAAPLWGTVADRFAGSRLVLPVAALMAAGGAAALAMAREPILIGLAVIAMSVAFSGLGPTLDARALETVSRDRDRYGGLRAWGSASFIVIVWITGALIERAGAGSMFVVYIGCLLVLALVAIPLRGAVNEIRLPRLTGIGVVLRQPLLARFFLAILLVWSAAMGINWYFSVHLLSLGAPGELVGASWAVGALVEVPIMAAYPWLVSRIGAERLLIAGTVAFAVRALALALLTDPLLATLTMAVHGIGFSLVLVGGVTYVARHAPPAVAATAQGILSATVFSLALIIGPGAGSFVAAAWGPSALFILAFIAGVAAVPLLWAVVGAGTAPAPEPRPAPRGHDAGRISG